MQSEKLIAMDSALIQHIKEKGQKLLPSGSSMLIFGSRARGDNREDSDWDILVLLNKDGRATGKDYDEIGYPLNELFWQHGQDVNTIIQTYGEWQQKSFTPFYKNVMQDAIAI